MAILKDDKIEKFNSALKKLAEAEKNDVTKSSFVKYMKETYECYEENPSFGFGSLVAGQARMDKPRFGKETLKIGFFLINGRKAEVTLDMNNVADKAILYSFVSMASAYNVEIPVAAAVAFAKEPIDKNTTVHEDLKELLGSTQYVCARAAIVNQDQFKKLDGDEQKVVASKVLEGYLTAKRNGAYNQDPKHTLAVNNLFPDALLKATAKIYGRSLQEIKGHGSSPEDNVSNFEKPSHVVQNGLIKSVVGIITGKNH